MSQAASTGYYYESNQRQQPQPFNDVSQAAQSQNSQLPNRQLERRTSTEVIPPIPGAPRLVRSRAVRSGNLPPRRLNFDDEIIPPVRGVLFPGF